MNVDLSLLPVREWMIASPVITPRTTIATALRLLREHGLSALPVWDRGRLVGMAYETDLLRMTPSEATTLDVYELREVLETMTVARVTVPAVACPSDASLANAASLMLRSARGIIPVVDAGRPVGLFTWAAFLRAVAEDTAPPLSRAPSRAPLKLDTRGAVPAAVERAR
jgi:acetoin utilization protein AcuB